jgi:hypothetical protein
MVGRYTTKWNDRLQLVAALLPRSGEGARLSSLLSAHGVSLPLWAKAWLGPNDSSQHQAVHGDERHRNSRACMNP